MVDDFEKFHGVALQSLVSSFDTAVLIKKTSFSRSAYLINKCTVLTNKSRYIGKINNQTLKKTDVDSIIKEVGEAPKTTA